MGLVSGDRAGLVQSGVLAGLPNKGPCCPNIPTRCETEINQLTALINSAPEIAPFTTVDLFAGMVFQRALVVSPPDTDGLAIKLVDTIFPCARTRVPQGRLTVPIPVGKFTHAAGRRSERTTAPGPQPDITLIELAAERKNVSYLGSNTVAAGRTSR